MYKFLLSILFLFPITLFANNGSYKKACETCDFLLVEEKSDYNSCKYYKKYLFKDKKIAQAYSSFGMYFVPKHKYAEYWKRFLPETKEKYEVLKENVDNNYVLIAYNIIPKEKHVREGKKANIEFIVNKDMYYFELREIGKDTEISECLSVVK